MVGSLSPHSLRICVPRRALLGNIPHLTLAHNDVVEHMNHTIQERVTSMLLTTHLPQEFWGEVVMIAIYIINQSLSTPLQFKILPELW